MKDTTKDPTLYVTKTFPVLEMSCAACAARVNKTLNRQEGVRTANVNYAAATATIEYNPLLCSPEKLKKSLQEAGYDLLTETGDNLAQEADKAHENRFRQLKFRTTWAIILAFPVAVIGMLFMDIPYASYIMWILSTPVVFWLGSGFYTNAWKQLRHRSANMDTLVATSTGIAYLFSLFNLFFPDFWTSKGITSHVYFEAASVIIAFILLGRLLEERAKGNTSTAIRKLMGLQPQTVTIILPNGNEKEIGIKQLNVGDTVLVRPGDRIAVDGIVTEGTSYVDESMLSGEPVAVHKSTGSKVYAGTINQKGSFRFLAEKVGEETILAHIIRMVQDAQGSKAPVQKLVDKIAGIFVPAIILIALISFILWFLLDDTNGFTHGLLAAVTVLIIACPCALGLATPTAIMVGIGKGAERGILIKDAESLETARKIDTIVLDKTGTLTEGKPVVTDLIWNNGQDHTTQVFYSLEKLSEHPLANAITEHLSSVALPITGFESITGEGVKGMADGELYLAGNLRMMTNHKISIPEYLRDKAERFTRDSKTVIWFADRHKALAIAAITDRIKGTSKIAVAKLQSLGIEVIMLTGDNEATAKAIAAEAGIHHYQAEMLPQQKASYIKKLQEEGRHVAMVGDGINDSAALAQADLSIAMGKGSDIAMDVAKMTIISSDLTKIPEAIRLSVLTVRTIRENLFWAFIYNLIGVPVAAGILYPVNGFLLNPMIAGAAMALSSVSVVTNSLRLRSRHIGDSLPGKDRTETEEPAKDKKGKVVTIRKTYRIEGMMCNHCRMHVEKALGNIPGATITVTLDPPVATIEYSRTPLSVEELQQIITEKAGDYTISE